MEAALATLASWVVILLLAASNVFLLWFSYSKSFFAEIINSFRPLVLIFDICLITILAIFGAPLNSNLLITLALIAINILITAGLSFKVILYSSIKATSAQGPKTTNNLRIGFFNKQIGMNNGKQAVQRAEQLGLDIFGISEVKPADFKDLKTANFPHQHFTEKELGLGRAEFALLSRYPIQKVEMFRLERFGHVMRADIKVASRAVAVFIVHTVAPISPELFQERNRGMLSLAKKLNQAAGQVLVMGDFNLSPYSHTYASFMKSISAKFQNITKGWGVNQTWCLFWPFCTQLDYIFTSKNFKVNSFRVGENLGSDHRLIWAEIEN